MLRAALDVIVERGYADTRIADVAERTGTSPALVIYYFKTRDQLLTEAIRYSEDTWYDEYTRRVAQIPDAAGRLAELIAMNCLPGTDPEPNSWWLLWLDLWALSPPPVSPFLPALSSLPFQPSTSLPGLPSLP